MAQEFRCPYCNKSCSSKSGLTLHTNKCKPPNTECRPSNTETRMTDPRDIDPRGAAHAPPPRRAAPTTQSAAPKQQTSNFNIGAFMILEHIPILLDLNFAAALSDHILQHGSENKAILAFGHQLDKVSGED